MTNTREASLVLTILNHFHLFPSGPLAVDAVLYLETTDFVTGEILYVDGGAHAGRW